MVFIGNEREVRGETQNSLISLSFRLSVCHYLY